METRTYKNAIDVPFEALIEDKTLGQVVRDKVQSGLINDVINVLSVGEEYIILLDEIIQEHNNFPNELLERFTQRIRLTPLVRCKDCKHHLYDSKGNPYCHKIDYGYGWKDDDFCSMAERRTDERFD